MSRFYDACLQEVYDRGSPPESFLDELVDWATQAPSDLFVENNRNDIYSSVYEELGPWHGLNHRKAVMLEVLRVLGGFESSWNWNEGVDISNPKSKTPCTEEAGIFQCSGDSINYGDNLKSMLARVAPDTTCESFIKTTKSNHRFAIEYCAQLLRLTTKHHGPIKFKEIHPYLRTDAVNEFLLFIL